MVNLPFGNIYKDKKVLITGNTGFKGSWLTVWLLKLGAKIYGLSKDIPTEPSMYENLNLGSHINQTFLDIRDADAVLSLMQSVKPDFVFHLAAQPIVSLSYSDPLTTISTNVIGTANILEALRVSNPDSVAVIITSDKCYDNVEWVWGYRETDNLGGKDIYSGSKGAAELICKSYYHSFFKSPESRVRVVTARAGNVIGGGDWAMDRIVPDCMRAWSDNQIVEIRNPYSTRPWQHVLEPLSGYLLLAYRVFADASLNGESFNFGPQSEYNHTVEELLKDLGKCWNFTKNDTIYKIVGNSNFHEANLLKLNCDKALFYLKWTPTLDYKSLIQFTGDWYYSFYKNRNNMFDFTLNQISIYEDVALNKNQKWII